MMAIAKTTLKDLPPWAQETARRIELLGFDWIYVEDYHLADLAKNLQVRDDEDVAPRWKVEEYKENMRNGDLFPPVIFTTDDWLVDGATRTLAAQALKRATFPAFRLRNAVYADKPSADLVDRLISLGGTQNITHGTNLSVKNRARIIELIAQNKGAEPSIEDIARQLHVKKGQVREVLLARDGRERAAKLGVDLTLRKLSWTHQLRLGTAAHNLNDEVFIAFARLMVMTGVSTTEVNSIITRMNECTNDEARQAILHGEAKSRVLVTTGVNKRPPVHAQFRQHAGWLEKNGTDDPSLLSDTSSLENALDQYEIMQRNASILRRAMGFQHDYIVKARKAEEAAAGEAT